MEQVTISSLTSSAEINEIAKAMAKAQTRISGADKDGNNPHFGRAYATLASVWESCHMALNENEIAIIQAPSISADGQQVLVTILAHGSGQWFRGEYKMNPVKNDPQGMGSAVTYARRYSLAAMTGVAPKDDDDDGNAASAGHGAQQHGGQQSKPVPTTQAAAAAQKIGDVVAIKVLEGFGRIGVTAEMLKTKLGMPVAEAPFSALDSLKSWRDQIADRKTTVAAIFGGSSTADRAAALNDKLKNGTPPPESKPPGSVLP